MKFIFFLIIFVNIFCHNNSSVFSLNSIQTLKNRIIALRTHVNNLYNFYLYKKYRRNIQTFLFSISDSNFCNDVEFLLFLLLSKGGLNRWWISCGSLKPFLCYHNSCDIRRKKYILKANISDKTFFFFWLL